MAALSDKTKKAIIAAKVEGIPVRKIAELYHVSPTTVQSVVKASPEIKARAEKKKEQNTLEMLAYMDVQKGKAQRLLTAILEALSDPEKLARANIRDLATAYGIITDKFIQAAPHTDDATLVKAREILGGIDGAIK